MQTHETNAILSGNIMNQLRWWEKDAPEKLQEKGERQIAFEESVFYAFPTESPSKEMPMVSNKTLRGNQWMPYEYNNDDACKVTRIFNWLPWTQLVGRRLCGIGDMLRTYPSVEALRYYAPAFMLHWLYFRHNQIAIDGEIEELFIPPDDKIICEKFSGYGFWNDRRDIDRFYWFRDGMTAEQRKVCREFCTLWVSWKYRDIDFSLVEEAYLRLLSYWE